MLDKPVLNIVDVVAVKRHAVAVQEVHQGVVLGHVVLGPLVEVGDLQEFSLFILKVSSHELDQVGVLLGILRVVDNVPDGVKESLVLLIKSVVEHTEGGRPDVGPWNFVGVSVQLGFVVKVLKN